MILEIEDFNKLDSTAHKQMGMMSTDVEMKFATAVLKAQATEACSCHGRLSLVLINWSVIGYYWCDYCLIHKLIRVIV